MEGHVQLRHLLAMACEQLYATHGMYLLLDVGRVELAALRLAASNHALTTHRHDVASSVGSFFLPQFRLVRIRK